jgi:hypothetical protein
LAAALHDSGLVLIWRIDIAAAQSKSYVERVNRWAKSKGE